MKYLAIVISALLLTACSEPAEVDAQLTYTVQKAPFKNYVAAKGELIAATETVISTPASSRGPQTLAWLMPEYSQVKKGEVVARFDGRVMSKQKRESEFSNDKVSQDLSGKNTEIDTRRQHLGYDMEIVEEEKKFAETFSIDDVRIISKLDILEQAQKVDYLNAKTDYFNWQSEQFNSSAQGELDLLNMQSQQHQSKIDMLNGNLSSLEVVAPHDGLLTHSVDWRGEKPRAGQTLWPGQKIAGLPDISVMQIKLFVKEREAINLQQDQTLEFSLISDPSKTFTGKVTKLAPFPKSIKRQDPQKYYELTASIDEQGAHLRPGLKVIANIIANQAAEKLVVPKFSVFADEEGAYVQLKTASGYSKTPVSLGQSNLSHVEITQGLSEGDVIALVDKEGKL